LQWLRDCFKSVISVGEFGTIGKRVKSAGSQKTLCDKARAVIPAIGASSILTAPCVTFSYMITSKWPNWRDPPRTSDLRERSHVRRMIGGCHSSGRPSGHLIHFD